MTTLTWPEVAQHGVLLVPLGSFEQHGPHLPLDTDTRIATAVAQAAADRCPGVVLGPTLTVGASGEHEGFPGTLSIGTDALTVALVELARSATRWCREVVFVVGHGGNADSVHAAGTLLHGEGRDVRAWFPQVPGGDAHAGHTETSVLLALDPSAVRRDQLVAGALGPLMEVVPLIRASSVRAVSPNGVLGDPREASAAAGEQILGALVDDLVEFVMRAVR